MKYITEFNKNGNIAVDDNILVKDSLNTAGSHILDGFESLFSAEAVERLEKAGYSISGKTNVGEFGLDLLGETSYYGAELKDGKLAGAGALLVADGEVEACLSVDLNGAPRRAALASNILFVKPTYSTVSRYGVIACACSGEQIGVSARNAKKAAQILSIIAGHDSKDGTSDKKEKYDYSVSEDISGKKACIIKELFETASDEVKENLIAFKSKLEKSGVTVEEISFDLIKEAATAWQILMSAETCNNVSKFDGVKYGYRTPNFKNIDDIYVGTRTEGMGFLAKAVILYGSDVLSKDKYESCYDKAMRIRRIVTEKVKSILSSYDFILTPVASEMSFSEYNTKEAFTKVFKESYYTVLATLSGLPAVVTNGVQLIGDSFKESTLLSVANTVEEAE